MLIIMHNFSRCKKNAVGFFKVANYVLIWVIWVILDIFFILWLFAFYTKLVKLYRGAYLSPVHFAKEAYFADGGKSADLQITFIVIFPVIIIRI